MGAERISTYEYTNSAPMNDGVFFVTRSQNKYRQCTMSQFWHDCWRDRNSLSGADVTGETHNLHCLNFYAKFGFVFWNMRCSSTVWTLGAEGPGITVPSHLFVNKWAGRPGHETFNCTFLDPEDLFIWDKCFIKSNSSSSSRKQKVASLRYWVMDFNFILYTPEAPLLHVLWLFLPLKIENSKYYWKSELIGNDLALAKLLSLKWWNYWYIRQSWKDGDVFGQR